MVFIKTPNNKEEDRKDTQKQQDLLFFFFLVSFYFNDVWLNRKSNSLEILYYGKAETSNIL